MTKMTSNIESKTNALDELYWNAVHSSPSSMVVCGLCPSGQLRPSALTTTNPSVLDRSGIGHRRYGDIGSLVSHYTILRVFWQDRSSLGFDCCWPDHRFVNVGDQRVSSPVSSYYSEGVSFTIASRWVPHAASRSHPVDISYLQFSQSVSSVYSDFLPHVDWSLREQLIKDMVTIVIALEVVTFYSWRIYKVSSDPSLPLLATVRSSRRLL